MKWFYLVGLLSLISGVWCRGNAYDNFDGYAVAKAVVEAVCQQGGADEARKSIPTAIEDLKYCHEHILPKKVAKLKASALSNENFCLAIAEEARACTMDILDIWRDCAEPELRFIADFIYDSSYPVNEYLCAKKAKALLKLFKPGSLDCAFNGYTSLLVCLAKVVFKPEAMITRSELCEDLPKMASCFKEHVTEQCPNDPDLGNTVDGFFKAIGSPCNNVNEIYYA